MLITGTLVDNPDSDGDGLTDGVETNTGNFVDKTNTGTDPNKADSDGDGVDDGDELFNGTDPNVNNYWGDGTAVQPQWGWFSGLVLRDGDNKPLGIIGINLTRGGDNLFYFSGGIRGINQPYSPFKGMFDAGGKYSGNNTYNANGILSVAYMSFIRNTKGDLSIGGVLRAPDGTRHKFNLVRKYYNETWRKPTQFLDANNPSSPARFTYLAPASTTDSPFIPAGDAIGYGTIASWGGVKITGWSNAGYKYSYYGPLQNGNQRGWSGALSSFEPGNYGTTPFYVEAYSGSKKIEWMLGTIRYDVSGGEALVDGNIRYVKPVDNNYLYPAGFDQDLVMEGSRYRQAGYAGIPAMGFEVFANNAVGLFEGSLPNNVAFNPYIFSWESDGDMKVPLNFSYFKQGSFKNWGGFYTGQYVDNTIGQTAWIQGVVLQNKGIVSGSAISWSSRGAVRHSIIPNDTGEVAPSASISPTSKKFDNIGGQSPGGTYSVSIEISPNSVVQNWTVDIPAEYDWVTADVTSGSGSATINITVSGRSTVAQTISTTGQPSSKSVDSITRSPKRKEQQTNLGRDDFRRQGPMIEHGFAVRVLFPLFSLFPL